MSQQPPVPSLTEAETGLPADPASDTTAVPSPHAAAPTASPTSSPSFLEALRLKYSQLVAATSTDRRVERRQVAAELAAALPNCRNCHNKAKLNCTNHRCHACCIATNTACPGHHDNANRKKRKSDTKAAVPPVDREAMLDALAVDDAMGLLVTGVVAEAVECGYRVRLLVNGYVCEGLLFDDTYVVTLDTLPDNITATQLSTVDTLPSLQHDRSRSLFPPPAASSATSSVAVQSKPKVRHPEGYPKGPRSGYVYYTAAMRARAQSAESEEEKRAVKVEWTALSERERAPYMRLAEMDKQRWMREMAEWNKRIEEGGGSSDEPIRIDC